MKVAVITRHAITNYGSFLQAYATQEALERMRHNCSIIDYIRPDEEYSNIEKTMLKQKPEWNSSIIKKSIYLAARQPESLIAGRRFEKYRNKYLHLTRRYSTASDLRMNLPVAECYMTGSDQVWGPIGSEPYDDSYFLSFVKDLDFKISYAASFGRSEQGEDVENKFKTLLIRYNNILVREDSAVSRIKKMGLAAQQVLDPTLLLDKDYWTDKINKESTREIINDGYILIYQLHNNKVLGNYAAMLAKKTGKRLIRVSASLHQISREGRFIYCPNPFDFLKLILGADCLITDSFHGTAFAINLNTPFIEVLPQNGTNTRNISILNLTGLNDRILSKDDDFGLIENEIDFDKVNNILSKERDKSESILKDVLQRRNEL